MGIPGFNTYFYDTNKQAYVPLRDVKVDHLYVDMNSLLHNVSVDVPLDMGGGGTGAGGRQQCSSSSSQHMKKRSLPPHGVADSISPAPPWLLPPPLQALRNGEPTRRHTADACCCNTHMLV